MSRGRREAAECPPDRLRRGKDLTQLNRGAVSLDVASASLSRRHDSRLFGLRHHKSLWLGPAALLAGALLPWPYGYYQLLRLAIFAVSAWIAYEQWRHDDAVSGWVVAFGGLVLPYNPIGTFSRR